MARWLEVLQSYSFTIQHRPGPKHSNADALSRRPCLTTDCKYCSQLELKDTQGAEPSSQPTVQAVNLSAGIIADMGIATSPEALRQAQLADENLKPVLEWLTPPGHHGKWLPPLVGILRPTGLNGTA